MSPDTTDTDCTRDSQTCPYCGLLILVGQETETTEIVDPDLGLLRFEVHSDCASHMVRRDEITGTSVSGKLEQRD